MTIISFDQSLRSTGVSILKDDKLYFKLLGAPASIKSAVKQLQFVTTQIQEVVLQEQANIILLEDLPYGLNSSTVRPLAALYFNILLFGLYWDIPVKTINITSAKKTAGKGNLKKSEMFDELPKEVKTKIKRTTKNKKQQFDLSDSYWILQTFLRKSET